MPLTRCIPFQHLKAMSTFTIRLLSGLQRPRLLLLLPILPALYILFYHISPAIQHNVLSRPPTWRLSPTERPEAPAYPYTYPANITVNLVIASIRKDDIGWATALASTIPNLSVIRYVGDSPSAAYHPPVAKSREALMYFTYLHDFYDALPDVSIFTHAEEAPWHMDSATMQSMTFALRQLDLAEVRARGYFNLRTSWHDACPAWINTSKSFDDWDKKEEPYMAEAWRANFGADVPVPEMLGGPCCSQFAVAKEAVMGRPREQYARSMQWLVDLEWGDYFAGRVWEHMWPWLFMGVESDCDEEVGALCRMYGICFEVEKLVEFQAAWDKRKRVVERLGFWKELWKPLKVAKARLEVDELGRWLQREMGVALDRGRSQKELESGGQT